MLFLHFALNTEAKKQHLLACRLSRGTKQSPASCACAPALEQHCLSATSSTWFGSSWQVDAEGFGFVSPQLVLRSFHWHMTVGDTIQARMNLKASHKQLFYVCVFQQTWSFIICSEKLHKHIEFNVISLNTKIPFMFLWCCPFNLHLPLSNCQLWRFPKLNLSLAHLLGPRISNSLRVQFSTPL